MCLSGRRRVVFLIQQARDKDLYEDWAFGGQSWVVGCRIPHTIKYPDVNELNEDYDHPTYSTLYGKYEPQCGLMSVLLNWSGAEYMHYFLQHNRTALPLEAQAIVRYLELDLWHSGTQYDHLTNARDDEMREWVQVRWGSDCFFGAEADTTHVRCRGFTGFGKSLWRRCGGWPPREPPCSCMRCGLTTKDWWTSTSRHSSSGSG
jgi:hypothetical protein